MQESDVIKALECCEAGIDFEVCDNCPRCIEEERAVDCFKRLHKATLDLIIRQKTEIDILIRKKEALRDEIAEQQAEIERYKGVIRLLEKDVATAKAEAYNEMFPRPDYTKSFGFKGGDWANVKFAYPNPTEGRYDL